jgi:hypothetical protein
MACALSDEYTELMNRFHYITGDADILNRNIVHYENDISELESDDSDLYTEEEMTQKKQKLSELKERHKYYKALLVVLEYESKKKWTQYQNALIEKS